MPSSQEQQQSLLSRLFQDAVKYHERGELHQAEKLYRQLLEQQTNNADVLHLLGLITSQMGGYEKSVEYIQSAIEIDPSSPDFYSNLALVHYNHGQYGVAASFCEEALKLIPDHPGLLTTLGNAMFQQGDYESAISAYGKALLINPENVITRFNLGNAYRESGKLDEAVQAFEECLQLKPDYAEAHNNLGNALRMQGEWQAAIAHFNEALKFRPEYAEAHVNLGLVLHQLGQYEDARAACEKALQLKPDFAEAYNTLGLVYHKLYMHEESRMSFERALQLRPDYAEAFNNLGGVLIFLRQLEEAQLMVEKALEIKPDFAEASCNLGNLHMLYGEFDKARAAYEKALVYEPGLAVARQNITGSRKFGTSDRDEITGILNQLADKRLTDEKKANLHFALGKIYDDSGQYETAFQHYKEGNDLIDKTKDFNPDENREYIDQLIDVYNSDFFKECCISGSSSSQPVFIIGMPRSGTTLVEQIIASHPLAFGADELMFFNQITLSLPGLLETDIDYPACVSQLDQATAESIISDYLDLLSTCSCEAIRITDKMPRNFLHLGLIAILFPKSSIVHCRRNSLDTCLSIYFQQFVGKHPYAYNLDKIGSYFRQYKRLMAHWRNVLPLDIYELDYESLIADQERESRRLIEYIGLPWDRKCLSFHKTQRVVMTASNWQVRQPMYSSSINRWKNYEHYLEPLKRILEDV